MFVVEFLLFSSIGYKILYHLPVHQRFPAEEINFQVSPVSGIGNQKIKSFFPHLK